MENDYTLTDQPAALISSVSPTQIVSSTEGGSTSLADTADFVLDIPPRDGVHVWRLSRTDWPLLAEGDKGGLLVGLRDSASDDRSAVAGIFATATSREVDRAGAPTINFDGNGDIDSVVVTCHLNTNDAGSRVIGPASVVAHDAAGRSLYTLDVATGHTVTGTVQEVALFRRGSSGALATNMGYSLTHEHSPSPTWTRPQECRSLGTA